MKKLVLIVTFLFLFTRGYTQVDHYWSWNFNTSSALLAGAVVGGVADVSSIYHNPGLIERSGNAQLAINASLFTLEWYNYEKVFGDRLDIQETTIQFQPRFISYTKNGRGGRKHQVAFFTRNSGRFNFIFNYNTITDILNQSEGDEFYSGEVQYSKDYNEKWFAYGLSQKISDKISIGLSTFLTYKSFDFQLDKFMLAYSTKDSVEVAGVLQARYSASYSDRQRLKAWNGRILWKGGFHYQGTNWGLGFAITSPSLNIIGGTDIKKEISRINIFNQLTGIRVVDSTLIGTNSGQKINAKDPFSVSAGIAYTMPSVENKILFTLEYFTRIKAYNMLANSTNRNQISENTNSVSPVQPLSVIFQAKHIVNVAFGYSQYINEKVSALAGFRTDFSYLRGLENQFSPFFNFDDFHYDIYHFTLGGEFHIRQLDFVAGVEYKIGRDEDLEQVVNFSDPLEYLPISGEALQGIRTSTMELKYNALSFFIGLTFNILEGIKD